MKDVKPHDRRAVVGRGIEVMRRIRKGQVECNHSSALSVVELINKLFKYMSDHIATAYNAH